MADVGSSSAVVQQPPSSTSGNLRPLPIPIPLVGAGDIQAILQPVNVGSVGGGGGGGGGGVVGNPGNVSGNVPNAPGTGNASTSGATGSGLIDATNNNNNNNSSNNPNNATNNDNLDGDGEPPAKKAMLENPSTSTGRPETHEKLEYRLGGILCCAVCLDLPKTAMYQCQMGHLMCAACFTHLLADGRLRDQIATCPNCRVEISKSTASRNLAVEKAASELPSECEFCNNEFPYKSLERHESRECQERPTSCKYSLIGCPWRGPNHEVNEHQAACGFPKKTASEVMGALEMYTKKVEDEKKVTKVLLDLLSYEKIIFNDLQMKPYRTDEYVHKLFYETARFSAFNQQWVVKARINNSQRDPHTSNERTITYQLILKTKTTTPMSIHFFALKGPFSDMKVGTQIYRHDFSEQSTESEYYFLPLPDSSECNRLLSNKGINFRLLMFLLNK